MIEPKEPKMETNYIWYATFSSTSEADVKTFIDEHKEDLMKLNDCGICHKLINAFQ